VFDRGVFDGGVFDCNSGGGGTAQRNLGAIHLEDSRIAAGSALSGGDAGAGEKAKFHQAAGIVGGEINVIEDRVVAFSQVNESQRVATQLQHL
jgi:hypothetical protein